ncbi:PadR family transcriptional regulator [Rhizobium lentis]|uniref:PadR family transcriptional regulator n=2 Tax=Rhizobium lentis TaxID=1138194 RepID=A0A9Q3MBS5_9HYPH|nr:PadR family transcriptional regulator [Rhizobium lentis]MBX4955391.1 PadR family transcriptional regulator [Rhizobium lentis]MBX4973393.1 PadR family transcriptional regulator [Rhizobium lentis]MBX4984698.1 PadR family transcriptional regulator [Rhizobium lentis]MBX4999843.1 PadR family transcriptional regulator [Rhizobium lentis]MBX5003143.1 PadR family transcriptional regulator [Rhizobium lentis]
MRGFKGGMFGEAFRMGRKFAAGDLQLVILALLAEQPRHGYELIKLLEERSGGFYVPSPGVIYPALTYLEETGLAEVENEGTKKLYRITEAGRQRVEENRDMILHTLAKLERIGEKMAYVKRVFETDRHGVDSDDGDFMQDGGDIRAARMLLRSALQMRYPWSKSEAARIAGILERAATEILQGGRPDARG